MRDFRELKVWQRGYQLALAVYKASTHFPTAEKYGLTSQLRRAAVSVVANIAEGCGRSGEADFARFLDMAMGSASELECCLQLARDLQLLDPPEYRSLQESATELKRMLTSLIRKVRAQGADGS